MIARIGHGWDVHRLVAGRPLVLGGVDVPSDRGEDGFSDGDALLHALIDALLGACALGDIGQHFPPGREEWRGISSRALLAKVRDLLAAAGSGRSTWTARSPSSSRRSSRTFRGSVGRSRRTSASRSKPSR